MFTSKYSHLYGLERDYKNLLKKHNEDQFGTLLEINEKEKDEEKLSKNREIQKHYLKYDEKDATSNFLGFVTLAKKLDPVWFLEKPKVLNDGNGEDDFEKFLAEKEEKEAEKEKDTKEKLDSKDVEMNDDNNNTAEKSTAEKNKRKENDMAEGDEAQAPPAKKAKVSED